MAEKRNIFLVGPMGAGKSTIGRQLAQQLNMDFVDSDAVIEERAGADISWIFDLEGEEGFRKREERILNSHKCRGLSCLLVGEQCFLKIAVIIYLHVVL